MWPRKRSAWEETKTAAHRDGFSKRWAGTILAAALLATMFAAPLAASVPCVTNLNDSGTGSLRDCITSGGTITFASSLNGGTITLGSTLNISASMTISGPGANLLTVSGGNLVQVFNISSGTVTISGLTIAHGFNGNGGGIYNNSGTLTVNSSTFSSNAATTYGGGIFNLGTLTVSNSTFSGNTSGNGGGINNMATLTVSNSTFFGNTAIGNGGGIFNEGLLTVSNGTLSGNTAGVDGGGIYTPAGAWTLNNSIVAGNTSTSWAGDDCDGCVLPSGGNLISTPSAIVNPQLAPLGWYGGSTQTMLPLPGSPAIGGGAATASDKPNIDQRGFARPTSGTVDLGAVQTNYLIVTTTTDVSDATPACTSGTGNTCSLRDAVTLANTAGSADIAFAAGVIGTINLSSALGALPSITGNLDLFGPGANILAVSGGNSTSVGSIFKVTSTNAAFSGITIANGNVLSSGGGIDNTGTLTVSNSTLSGNSANVFGGGIFNNNGTLIVSSSTFSGNGALLQGGGIYNGAGTLAVNNSTLSGNTTIEDGGGIFNRSGTLIVTNSTLSGNYNGGGIFNAVGTLTVNNSIVVGDPGYDCSGNGCGTLSSYNLFGGAPQLAPLAYYGGPTQTMLPLPGSPAICAGSAALDPAGLNDQRGFPRLNTTYTGYSASSPCLDLGAVQTNYQSVQFAQSGYSGKPGVAVSSPAAPVVSVMENGQNIGAVPVTLSVTGGTPTVTGNGPVTTVAGTGAQFPSLTVSPGGSYTLGASLAITSSVTISNTAALNIDIAPTVTSLTSTSASGTYTTTAVINITVNFSKIVNVTGTPQLALNSGGTASYTSGTGTSALVFAYTVASPQSSTGLDASSTSALTLNGGTITDAATAAANLTLPTPGAPGSLSASETIVINTTQYTLALAASPSADGTVQANPTSTQNVTPSLPAGTYLSGSSVTLTATPSSNMYKFSKWTGTTASTSNPLILTMTSSVSETANFVLNNVNVTINTFPQGLLVSVDGTEQTAPVNATWLVGSQHTLSTTTPQRQVPGVDYESPTWSDGGAISHTVTASLATTAYTVTFEAYYRLTVTASPSVGGTVKPALENFYQAGSVVSIEASPKSGYTFKNWTGNVAKTTSASTTVTMTAPESVTANFAKK